MYKFSGLAEQLAQLRQRIPAHVSGKVPAHVLLNKREKNVFQQGLGSISYKTMWLKILSGLKLLKYKALRKAGANTALCILLYQKGFKDLFNIGDFFPQLKRQRSLIYQAPRGYVSQRFPGMSNYLN